MLSSNSAMTDKGFSHIIHQISVYVLKAIVVVMMMSLILGTINLVYVLAVAAIKPPNPGIIDVVELYSVFKLVLIIVVGYELIKSILLIMESDTIPARAILSIALIALANKVITLDINHSDPIIFFGLAALVLSFGAAIYMIGKSDNQEKKKAGTQ
jgi:uncharacterized membrane protein (DUF373 family)